MRSKNFLAGFFNWAREVIESAETPFVLFALIVLPILAPVVPAFVTGLRLHTELEFHPVLSTITAIVLELLGYVGAIAFIKSIYNKLKRRGSFLSVLMNGIAYGFYVTVMYSINVQLGLLAGDSAIVNQIFALLSFITVPTGLLAAEHINERNEKEEEERLRKEELDREERLRQEVREDRLERYKIKHEGSRNNGKNDGKFPEGLESSKEVSKKVPDWRKVRLELSREDMKALANLTPDQIREYASKTGFTYKTISNWRKNANLELETD